MVSGGELLKAKKFSKIAYVGHFDFSLTLAEKIKGYPLILLGRDPRDVVTSYCSALFGEKVPPEPLLNYIKAHDLAPATVLATLITGTRDDGLDVPGIGEQFLRYYLKWLPHASVAIRFEDLRPQGEDWSKPIAAARQILALVNLEKNEEEILQLLKEASEPAKSRTFHKGKPGRWAEVFTPAHIALFEATAPNLLHTLRYPGFGGNASEERLNTAAPSSGPTSPAPSHGDAALAAYTGVLPALLSSFDSLSSRFGRLKAINDQVHTRVSFVTDNVSGIGYFCWTDDYHQRSINQTFSDHKVYDAYVAQMEKPEPMGSVIARNSPASFSPLARAIEPYLSAGMKIHFLDVGCLYGMEVCVVARLLEKYGDLFSATAFDPGWAGRLAPHNIAINHVAERVTFSPLAVTWQDGTAIVYGEYGQCENFRTVNRMVDNENCSYPVKAVTLDTYTKDKGIKDACFIKIDIQGGEFQALKGAQRVLREQCAGLMIKFIPHALSAMIQPEDLLNLLPARPYRLHALSFYQIFADGNATKVELNPADFPKYVADLQKAREDYSYLLVTFEDMH